jgi:hypothetical protein
MNHMYKIVLGLTFVVMAIVPAMADDEANRLAEKAKTQPLTETEFVICKNNGGTACSSSEWRIYDSQQSGTSLHTPESQAAANGALKDALDKYKQQSSADGYGAGNTIAHTTGEFKTGMPIVQVTGSTNSGPGGTGSQAAEEALGWGKDSLAKTNKDHPLVTRAARVEGKLATVQTAGVESVGKHFGKVKELKDEAEEVAAKLRNPREAVNALAGKYSGAFTSKAKEALASLMGGSTALKQLFSGGGGSGGGLFGSLGGLNLGSIPGLDKVTGTIQMAQGYYDKGKDLYNRASGYADQASNIYASVTNIGDVGSAKNAIKQICSTGIGCGG